MFVKRDKRRPPFRFKRGSGIGPRERGVHFFSPVSEEAPAV